MPCCGHLLGPGQFHLTSWPSVHAHGCQKQSTGLLRLRPFWAVTGTRIDPGHVTTTWEIQQGVAHDRFDPSMAMSSPPGLARRSPDRA